jgi:glycosyltransferase involved in cell wall biosynthesis
MLAIIATHPIQYQTPIWSALASDGRVPFEVWYLSDFGVRPSFDPQFEKVFRWDIETLAGYPYQFLETASGSSPSSFWKCRLREQLRLRIRSSGVKAVWVQGWQVAGYWQAVREAVAAEVKVWLRAESNDLAPVHWWKKQAKRAALGYLFSHVDLFLCIGSANERLYRRYNVPQAKMFSAPYAVDNDRFGAQAIGLRSERAKLRRAWGIADDAFCILFCGKLIDKKRPMDIVNAVNLLRGRSQGADIHLLFVGTGKLGHELRAACNATFDAEAPENTKRNVDAVAASFAGFLNQTEISRAYVAADCLVLPSDYGETWGLVVNEALASGLPCIVSDACGCAEDLIEKGLSFPLGNQAELADRIVKLRARGSATNGKQLPTFKETVDTVARAYFSQSE